MTWTEKGLDDLGYVSRGRSKHRPRDAGHLYGGAYPFIQTGDVKHSTLYVTQYNQTYSDSGLAQSKLWKTGTLCITIAANIADTAILGIDACFPDSVIGFVPDDDKADARFIKYLFDTRMQKRFKRFTQGAAQDNLSQEKLLSLKFSVPDVDVQKRIADILSTYDEFFENNRRRIQLLEQAVKLLFQEWFVLLRFPGHERIQFVNDVPSEWRSLHLPDIITINPPEQIKRGESVRYIPMAALSEHGMTVDVDQAEVRDQPTSVKFRNGDVLLARITPCLENGKTAFVYFLPENEVACGSTEFIVLRGKIVSPFFVYCLARTHRFRENAIKSMTGSSGRQRVQTSSFDEFQVCVPPQVLLDQFDEFARDCFSQIATLQRMNHQLLSARDLLLPRLMNGEIAV
jgi:type I restriction enzyme S subunit